jgi:phosphoglycolate phosphatase
MPRRYELLVFDWDGTLMDSAGLIARSIQAAARDLGLPVPDDAMASHVIGLGLADALALAVPALERADYPRIAERYRYHFLAGDTAVPLFAGTEAMLAALSGAGHVLAIATGKSRNGLERALTATGVGGYFACVRTADLTTPKPAPDMLLELMEELAADKRATLMIGDTTHDLEMAANAGVDAVAVTHGAHPEHALAAAGPLATVHNTAELHQWLMRNA